MTRPAFKPIKPRDPEQPKAAVARLFEQVGGAKNACIIIDRSPAQTYAYADPAVTDQISFAQVAALTTPESPAGAEYLALRSGGVFVPIGAAEGDIGEHTAESIKQSGEACAEIVQAMRDGKIDAVERPNVIRELDEAIRTLVQLRLAVASSKSTDS